MAPKAVELRQKFEIGAEGRTAFSESRTITASRAWKKSCTLYANVPTALDLISLNFQRPHNQPRLTSSFIGGCRGRTGPPQFPA
jgi:hypothetical protein